LPVPDAQGITWLQLPARSSSIEEFRAFILSQAQSAGLPDERLPVLELAIEELLVNIVSYAYDQTPGAIRVGCGANQGRFLLRIEDQGRPFDPIAQPHPDPYAAIDDRTVGGWGIHLVRSLADSMSYSREADCNLLEVQFAL
jgi:serine/threonine-protein kinase RsbW